MKILYRAIDDPSSTLEKQGMKVDELQLPNHILSVLVVDLEKSNALLPASAKTLQEWNVGLLER